MELELSGPPEYPQRKDKSTCGSSRSLLLLLLMLFCRSERFLSAEKGLTKHSVTHRLHWTGFPSPPPPPPVFPAEGPDVKLSDVPRPQLFQNSLDLTCWNYSTPL